MLKIRDKAPDFRFIIVENKSNKPDILRLQYSKQNNRLKSVGYLPTVLDMNCLMSKSLKIIDPDLFFCPDFPEFLLPKDDPLYKGSPSVRDKVITWGIVRKEPGTVSGPIFRGTQELQPRIREYIALLADDQQQYFLNDLSSGVESYGGVIGYLKVRAQFFDNLIQYNIWSKSNYEVEYLTEWLEQYMLDYRGMFREMGIVNMYFYRRIRDDTLVQVKNGYHLRSVLYYIRTERVEIDTQSPIKRINLNIDVGDLQAIKSRISQQDISHEEIEERIIEKWININKIGG